MVSKGLADADTHCPVPPASLSSTSPYHGGAALDRACTRPRYVVKLRYGTTIVTTYD